MGGAGLIDSTTGLSFGVSLEWQEPIGGGTLAITIEERPPA